MTCGKVRLVETITVPRELEMVMSANVGAVSDEVTGIIEPCPGFVSKHSILVARVVACLTGKARTLPVYKNLS